MLLSKEKERKKGGEEEGERERRERRGEREEKKKEKREGRKEKNPIITINIPSTLILVMTTPINNLNNRSILLHYPSTIAFIN